MLMFLKNVHIDKDVIYKLDLQGISSCAQGIRGYADSVKGIDFQVSESDRTWNTNSISVKRIRF